MIEGRLHAAAGDRPQRRWGTLTSEQVAALDRAAAAAGVSVLQLMEIAGWQAARCAWKLLRRHPAAVLVCAGSGNNGGDALVAARHLRNWGCAVTVWTPTAIQDLREPLRTHAGAARACGTDIAVAPPAADQSAALRAAALVIDGLLGTGLSAPPREPVASWIRAANDVAASVLSLDVPSGLDASTGAAHDPCIRATATCTFAAVKAGLWTEPGRQRAGRIWVADIGIPASAWAAIGAEPPRALHGGVLVSIPSATP